MSFVKTGLIGHPVAHSKSPLIHQYWINQYGLEGAYTAHDIAPENLESGVQDLIGQGYRGFNVTVPYKQSIMALCDHVDDLARSVGAVNTVTLKEGQLHGTNTDVYGFLQNIRHHQPDFNFRSARIAVLGAGGAAHAALYGLLQQGVPEIVLLNRSLEKAEALAAQYSRHNIDVLSWHDPLSDVSMVVNTTPLGMMGYPSLDVDLTPLSPDTVVYDIVYAPLYTDFLLQAQAKNMSVITGIGMLLHQARPAFEQWFGVMPEIDTVLERRVLV